jgi:hypothetical protein
MKRTLFLAILTISTILSSCKKDDPSGDSNGVYYYEATIDGVKYKVSIPLDNFDPNLMAGSGIAGSDDVVFSSNISDYRANGSELGITKGVMSEYFNSTNQEFRNFFAPGNYNYSSFGQNGVTIDWLDKSGKLWSTENAPALQNGSSFKIVSIEDLPDSRGILYIKTTIQFSCKLYDEAGNVKQASGTYVGIFGKI